jgi:perosamine synthetase
VADAAAALGATSRGRPLAGLADLTVFSFNGNKTITTGGGGMVVGDDRSLVDRVRHLSSTARVGSGYEHDAVGYNYRLTNLEAALGVAQLARLPEFLAAKTRIRRAYDQAFGGRADVSPFPDPPGVTSGYWFSGVVLGESCPWTVAGLCAALAGAGIQARPFWKPIHLQIPYREAPRGELPVTEAVWARVLTLPCSTSLAREDQAFVIETLLGLLDGGDCRRAG